jgi:hypothetical protein
LRRRLEALEAELQTERRLAVLEARAGASFAQDSVPERFAAGQPVAASGWRTYIASLHRDPVAFDSARHSSWRAGR